MTIRHFLDIFKGFLNLGSVAGLAHCKYRLFLAYDLIDQIFAHIFHMQSTQVYASRMIGRARSMGHGQQ